MDALLDELLQEFKEISETRIQQSDVKEALKSENMARNRYQDVFPYDFNRITIKSGPVNYINASMVRAPNNPRQFIVTQGPLQNTINDFWQMIVENNCKTIIMLCKTVEKGVEKCAMYWPEEGERLSLYNGLELFQTRCDFIQEIGAYERIFEIRDKKGSHIHSVVQLNYTRWPDRKTPRPESFAKFVQYSRRAFQSHSQGVVVHCSAGVGRSGTFLTIDSMLCDPSADVKTIVKHFRSQRMLMVQNFASLLISSIP